MQRSVLTWARWAQEQVGQWHATTDAGEWDESAVRLGLARLAHDLNALPAPTEG